MKFIIDISELKRVVKLAGAENIPVDFYIDFDLAPIDDIDIELEAGKEISTEQIQETNGLLTHAGRQVILYIKDHTSEQTPILSKIKEDGSKGRKFHITDCKTLKDMRKINKFDRYVVTTNTSGYFKITGRTGYGGIEEDEVQLKVCRYCLGQLNYNEYSNSKHERKDSIVNNFNILEFFEQYSSFIRRLPSGIAKIKPVYYTEEWKEISSNYRKSLDYTCEECGVKLINHKHLLHVHHKNSIKGDNSSNNLIVLCYDCHKKQPNHQHMQCKKEDIISINKLRVEQGIIKENINTWEEVYKYSDTALYGIINMLEKNYVDIPRLHKYIDNIKVEMLWVRYRVGISLEEKTIKIKDYTIYSHKDIIENTIRFLNIFKLW